MFRLLRSGSRPNLLRRCFAMLFGLLVSMAALEPAVADACDEDSSAASSAGMMMVAEMPESSGSNDTAPDHTVHLCHCVHVHSASIPANTRVSPQLLESTAAWSDRNVFPASASADMPLRPPRSIAQA